MTKISSVQWATSLWRVATERYGDRLHRFLLKRLGRQEAEDVAQELHLRLMQVPHNQFIRNPEAYIFSVARQVVSEFSRRQLRLRSKVCADSEQLEHLIENPEEYSADEVAQSLSSAQFLKAFLDQLPPEQAAAILLYERDGYSYAEIASMLNASERAVQRYLLKARDRLHQMLILEHEKEPPSQERKRHL